MPYRQVTRAIKSAGRIAGHSRRHARRVAVSATDRYRDRLAPGREFLDLYEYPVLIGEDLEARKEALRVIDDRHAELLQTGRNLRQQRDLIHDQLREDLVQLKKTSEGHWGPGAGNKVFHEDPQMPADAAATHRLAARTHETLSDPGFRLKPVQPGAVVSPKLLAKSFAGRMTALGDVLEEIENNDSDVKHSQSQKDAGLEELERFELLAVRFLEAHFALAGHQRLAQRLRNSSHVKSGETVVEFEAGAEPTDAAEPAPFPALPETAQAVPLIEEVTEV